MKITVEVVKLSAFNWFATTLRGRHRYSESGATKARAIRNLRRQLRRREATAATVEVEL